MYVTRDTRAAGRLLCLWTSKPHLQGNGYWASNRAFAILEAECDQEDIVKIVRSLGLRCPKPGKGYHISNEGIWVSSLNRFLFDVVAL